VSALARVEFRPLFSLLSIALFFTASGACGLLYQVVWTRQLVLLFGSTAHAVGTVLAIFFLGLGLGALWGGRLADRSARPLLLYGVFEVLIAIWALVLIGAFAWGDGLIVALLRAVEGSRGLGVLLRALMAALLLILPVTLMGATLPLLAKQVNVTARVRGIRVGALYTINTLGAVLGCYLTGFYLIEALGYTNTMLAGAAVNALVGVLAIGLHALLPLAAAAPAQPGEEAEEATDAPAVPAALLIGAYACTGFAALALEVLWTRLLAIVFLGTTYAYTTMLTTLLCGIAAGSAVGSLLVRGKRPAASFLGLVFLLTGGSCIYTLSWIASLPATMQETSNAWEATTRAVFWMSFIALFPPTFLFGLSFPLIVGALGRHRDTLGRDLGRLYAANTFGGVLGSLAGGFLIIPLLGTHHGIVALSAIFVFAGLLLLLRCGGLPGATRVSFLMGGAALCAAGWLAAPADVSQALNVGYIPADHRVIHFHEGTEGTVAVSEPTAAPPGADRVLWINRVQATTSIEKGVRMNRFQGVLPMLFDRDPKRILFMCFGSGITCGTLALANVEQIDAVEISPDVLTAAPLFEKDNLGVWKRPNVQFHIDDGRNFLLTTQNAYDLITFEPMPLALAGVSTFYTREFYEHCKARLTQTGLVSQWVPLHSLNPDVVRGLVRTFTDAFPHATAWFINADLFLIGSKAPLALDFDGAARRITDPELITALRESGFQDLQELYAAFLMDDINLRRFAASGRPMTDDLPWAEFEAPRLVYEGTVPDSLEMIQAYISSPVSLFPSDSIDPDTLESIDRRHRAHKNDIPALQLYYKGMAIDPGVPNRFFASLDIDPEDSNAKHYLRQIIATQAEAFIRWQEYDKAEHILFRASTYLPEWDAIPLYYGDLYHAQGDPDRAATDYQRHLDMGGHEPRARERATTP